MNSFVVIPTTDEKYISFGFFVWVNSFVDKNGGLRNVHEVMRFLDSFKFMPQCLWINWRVCCQKITYLESQFHTKKTPTQISFLKRKGVYPYSHMDSFDEFTEEKLPTVEFRKKNTFEGGEVSITNSDLQNANLVFQKFDCKTIGDLTTYIYTTMF